MILMRHPTIMSVFIAAIAFQILLSMAHASTPASSINWSGYVAVENVSNPQNGTVTAVNGSWVVQSVTQTPNATNQSFSSQWIGIDGYSNTYLIQTGTESDSANVFGSPTWAWYELLPNYAIQIPNFTVNAGDVMFASITLMNSTSHKWDIYLEDITQNETFNITVNYATPESSAEWIDERPYVGYWPPLADFHQSFYGPTYTNGIRSNYATINGVTSQVNSFPNINISMTNPYLGGLVHPVQAYPTSLSQNSSFTVIVKMQAQIGVSKTEIDLGNSSTLSASIYGGVLPYTYQWYEQAPGAGSYTAIKGANSSEYIFSTNQSTRIGTWLFELNVTDASGVSNMTMPVSVAVNTLPVFDVQAQSSSNSIFAGQNVSLTVPSLPVNGSAPFTYNWAVKAPNSNSFVPISNSGMLRFVNATPYPFNTSGTSCVSSSNHIYCSGGLGDSKTGYTLFGFAPNSVYGKVSGNNITWNTSTQYPANIANQDCVAASSYMYCIGGLQDIAGETNSTQSVAQLVRLDAYAYIYGNGIVNGSLTTQYPYPSLSTGLNSSGFSCATYNDYIYCVGGTPWQSAYYSSAYYAHLSSSGVGPWFSTTLYPTAIAGQSCTTYGGYIYCIGGENYTGSFLNKVYYAPVTANGIGAWETTTPYPLHANYLQCNTYSGYIYCTEGQVVYGSSELYANQSFFAHISSNGSISQWVAEGSFWDKPANQQDNCAVSNGYMYCVSNTGAHVFADKLYPSSYVFNSNSSTPLGTYEFELIATDTDGVSVNSLPASVTINSHGNLTAYMNMPANRLAVGQNETLTTNVTGGTPPYSYEWLLNGNRLNQTVQAITITANSADIGPNNVTVIVTDSAFHEAIASSIFTVINVNTLVTVPLPVIDVGTNESLNAYISGISPPYTYAWSINGNPVGGNSSTLVFIGNLTTQSGSPDVVDVKILSGGVYFTATNTLTVNPRLNVPTPTAQSSSISPKQSDLLTESTPSGGTAPYSYQWLEEAPSSSSFSVIPGATSLTYDFETKKATQTGTWFFEIEVTDNASAPVSLVSNPVSITIKSGGGPSKH